jgi:hypothetical protein
MIALFIFPLLSLATLIAISLSVGDDHKDRWELNEANPCCGNRASVVPMQNAHEGRIAA